MNNKSLGTATLAVLGFAVLPAQTDSITQTASVPQQSTDITNEVLLPLIEKFNTALGTLNQVIVEFDGRIVTTTGLAENLDAEPQKLTANLQGQFTLSGPDGVLFSESVIASAQKSVSAFDGSIPADFVGPASFDFQGLAGTKSDTATYTVADPEFTSFLGGANEPLDTPFIFSATSTAQVTGAANLANFILTEAGADVSVTYNYMPHTTSVPEPGVVLGLAIVSSVVALRRKWIAASVNCGEVSPG
ncbi:MAG: choice-of-anchor E domain-containing protein [Cyanobacteria bacterium J06628_6]